MSEDQKNKVAAAQAYGAFLREVVVPGLERIFTDAYEEEYQSYKREGQSRTQGQSRTPNTISEIVTQLDGVRRVLANAATITKRGDAPGATVAFGKALGTLFAVLEHQLCADNLHYLARKLTDRITPMTNIDPSTFQELESTFYRLGADIGRELNIFGSASVLKERLKKVLSQGANKPQSLIVKNFRDGLLS